MSRLRQAVEQHEVGLRLERQVLRGGHRRLGRARIDDDDLGLMRVAHTRCHMIGMGDARFEPTSTITSDSSKSA